MRFLLKVSMSAEAGNAAVKSGKLGETMAHILKEQTPEAVYFAAVDGLRTGFLVVNMTDASQLPAIAEP